MGCAQQVRGKSWRTKGLVRRARSLSVWCSEAGERTLVMRGVIRNIKVMKLFPVPFMGVGANYRRLLYTESGKFEDLELTGTHTLNNLIKWNNLTIEVLKNG